MFLSFLSAMVVEESAEVQSKKAAKKLAAKAEKAAKVSYIQISPEFDFTFLPQHFRKPIISRASRAKTRSRTMLAKTSQSASMDRTR